MELQYRRTNRKKEGKIETKRRDKKWSKNTDRTFDGPREKNRD